MDHQNYHQPPLVDLNHLDENYEIRMDYDNQGNLIRVRKIRRMDGCGIPALLLVLAMIAVGLLQCGQ